MKKILFAICLMMSCASPKEREEIREKNNVNSLHNYLSYYKDERTGICYAGAFVGYTTGYFTSVLCTPEVEKVAEKFTSK